MSGGSRLLAGVGAVVLVVSALGIAAPGNSEAPASDTAQVTVDR